MPETAHPHELLLRYNIRRKFEVRRQALRPHLRTKRHRMPFLSTTPGHQPATVNANSLIARADGMGERLHEGIDHRRDTRSTEAEVASPGTGSQHDDHSVLCLLPAPTAWVRSWVSAPADQTCATNRKPTLLLIIGGCPVHHTPNPARGGPHSVSHRINGCDKSKGLPSTRPRWY